MKNDIIIVKTFTGIRYNIKGENLQKERKQNFM